MRSTLLVIAILVAATPASAQRRERTESPAAPLYRAGMQLLTQEYWGEAAEKFEEAIDVDENFALAFYGLGRARIGQQQYTAAVSALERCRALYLSEAGTATAQRMTAAQRRRDQILELREVLRTLQTGPQGARSQRATQQIQDQIQDLEMSARSGTDIQLTVPAFVSLSLGSAHFRRGAMSDAEREYRAAIRSNPRMGEAHNNLAVVLLMTGRPEEAEKSVKDAERNGFRVASGLKQDIRNAKR